MSTQSICSICGANYEYLNGRWKCPACGAYKAEELSNEEVTLLYSAAQKLRLSNFSEAEEAYSDIIEKYPENANAYWGRLLSKYGIKYEEDFDGRKIPTCYAASIESVIDDNDYSKAIELADKQTKDYFVKQAEYIERVRKEWIDKAKKEKPYDVFICYKDSDLEKGIERTADSVVAQDLYIHLTEQGYRVFYSRESLRDKVGEKYEPYIFNALATAKVMLVYGSSAEYIKSTWLKNEWHRFYKKVASGEKHSEALIVACDGFSPSELPTILSSKQCLDAKRKTFFLDLDKCIKRIVQESPKSETPYIRKDEKLFSGLHEHTYKTKVVKATCIAKGYTIHKCDCGYEYRDSYTPLVDHKFKIIDGVPPTCTTDGREEKACEICGEKTTVILPALKHQYSKWVESKHPTCTEDGEEQRKCLRCGITETKVLPKTGHQFGGWTANPDGSHTSYCQNCGIGKTESKTVDAKVIPLGKKAKVKSVISVSALIICALLGFLLFYSIFGLSQLDTHLENNIAEWGEEGQRKTYSDMQQLTITTLVISVIQIVVLVVGVGYWDKNKKRAVLVLNILSAVSFFLALAQLWTQIDTPPTWISYSYYVDVAMVIAVINIIMSSIQLAFSIILAYLSKKNTIDTNAESNNELDDGVTIRFSKILSNFVSYWKSFFTSETTKAQKTVHFVGWSVILSFITMFSTIGSATVDDTSVTVTSGLTVFAGIWIFINIPLVIGSLFALSAERVNCKKNNLPLPTSKYSRMGLKIISNWLLILCSMFTSLASIPEESSKPSIMITAICAIWSLVFALYAHCPKQYKKIRVGNNTVMKKYCVAIAGALISLVCFIIMIAWIAAVTA